MCKVPLNKTHILAQAYKGGLKLPMVYAKFDLKVLGKSVGG